MPNKKGKKWLCSLAVCAFSVSIHAMGLAEQFYRGKTIRLIPYVSPGSAQDILARLATPYLKKYIEGQPNVIVQNMPGAGGVIVSNYMYNVAEPDGLSVGVLARGTPVLGLADAPGVEYDPANFRWVLSPSRDITVCLAFSDTGFKTIKDVIGAKKPLIVSATGRAAGSFQVPAALNATLGTNMKIITGYRGSGGHRAAMERRESEGRCLSYYGTKVDPFLREGLASGTLTILAQLPDRHAELPDVPVVNDMLSSPEDRALINLIASPLNMWVVPPETPDDRLEVLREGFMQAFQDPGFRERAAKAGFELDPISGGDAEELNREVLDVPSETKEKLKRILGM